MSKLEDFELKYERIDDEDTIKPSRRSIIRRSQRSSVRGAELSGANVRGLVRRSLWGLKRGLHALWRVLRKKASKA